MIAYDQEQVPPAPMIQCKVTNPDTGKFKEEDGKIDSGAADTIIPEEWLSDLSLMPLRSVTRHDYTGAAHPHVTCYVNFELAGFEFQWFEVLAQAGRENVLIGRNILNQLNVLLYGKKLQFEVTDP